MTGIVELLTTFGGRIGRQQWWIGFVIVLLGSIVGTLLFDPASITSDVPTPPSWPDTIWQLAWLWPGTAITVKRFNDRGWPWWLGYVISAVTLIFILPPHFGLVIEPGVGGTREVISWLVLAVLLLTFIDNGFIRGTAGPNHFGPDPLAGKAA